MCDEDLDILEQALEASVDDTPVDFGKHKGRTPREILYNDPGYIVWAKENTQRFECSEELLDQAYEDSFTNKMHDELADINNFY